MTVISFNYLITCHTVSRNEVKLFELDDHTQESVRSYTKQRFVMERLLRLSGKPFVLIQGPRGVGQLISQYPDRHHELFHHRGG